MLAHSLEVARVPFTEAEILARIQSVPHWYHQIPIAPGITTPGINDSAAVLAMLELPADCTGMRVLDLGTRDGYFAFELERRGADVLAIDYMPAESTGFRVAADLLGSRVRFAQDNLYNVSVEKYGRFDMVLFLGLLYHLRDPLWALDIVRSVCTGTMYLETQVIDDAFLLPDGKFTTLEALAPALAAAPLMQFYPRNALNNDFTNYWAPNLRCLHDMVTEANFRPEATHVYGQRALIRAVAVTDEAVDYQRRIARGVI